MLYWKLLKYILVSKKKRIDPSVMNGKYGNVIGRGSLTMKSFLF